uniref:RRM domain-containing protein n=1 Tax=Acrobeloides nanus TaxID=290746 RepID=A0A914C581_9BILA
MSRQYNENFDAKVYVGGLPDDVNNKELEDIFHKFGRIRKIWIARKPPGFAFIEFEDVRDAEDAVKMLDGTRICGVRAKVELSHGRKRVRGGRDDYGRGSSRYNDRKRERHLSRSPDYKRNRSRSPGYNRDLEKDEKRDQYPERGRSYSR